jgi:hypothetical protein
MECINATSLHRKSGQMGHPAFVAGEASCHPSPTSPWTESWGLAPRLNWIRDTSPFAGMARPRGPLSRPSKPI